MISWTELSVILPILFLSTFTRSSLGFGDALVAMPLLAMTVGMQIATPLVALIATTTAIVIFSRNWRQADLRACLPLVAASLAGIPLGLYGLKHWPEAHLKIILGVVVLGFAAYNLAKPNLRPVSGRWQYALLFGFAGGILGGAYNTNGIPVVIYGRLRHWAPQQFRATMQGYLLPVGFGIATGHALSGFWSGQILSTYLIALPVVFVAIFLGGRVNRRFDVQRFGWVVNSLLIIMGGLLILRNLG